LALLSSFLPGCLLAYRWGSEITVQTTTRVVAAVCAGVVLLAVLGSCAAFRPGAQPKASLQTQYQRLRARLARRADSTHSASYRVRWRARGIEPHAEMILRIDYQAPSRFHIVGKGPMDIPVFTAWVADSAYVLLEHRKGRTTGGYLREFESDEFAVGIRQFGAFLRLFTGGCGISLPDSFDVYNPGFLNTGRKDFVWADGEGRTVHMDLRKGCLKRIEWVGTDPGARWDLQIKTGRFSDDYPFWELRSARWENKDGPGEYRWEILAQKYNPSLPQRLFIPPIR